MPRHEIESASTAGGLPVAPSMAPGLATVNVPRERAGIDARVVRLCGISVGLAIAAGLIAQLLAGLINLITNLAFFGRFSTVAASPAANQLGAWAALVPVAGALAVGVMARFGSKAIRGHGIPEAMEQVLTNESRIPPRITFLKPISAAISIGTGGPFGAEGPIIATGGALGSLVGQLLHVTPDERKALLAAGAAAGMSATFGAPVSAVLLAVELLLFELRPRSLLPVALATATAAAVRVAFVGSLPAFAMPDIAQPGGAAQLGYLLIGAWVGLGSVGVTRLVYVIEDAFERLPIHWMWWPALGAVAVGGIGLIAPRTMGVGYQNIEQIVGGELVGRTLAVLCGLKLVSWAISLGSGTSGGTLAPLLTIGGGAGALLGSLATALAPSAGIDPRVAGLVGMAAMFAGASRALLTSVVFAFETTRQPLGLPPLLGGCAAAYLVSALLMRNTIMSEKIVRRGVRVPADYSADPLDGLMVRDCSAAVPISLRTDQTLGEARSWLASAVPGAEHQGFPLLDAEARLRGLLSRRAILSSPADLDTPLAALIDRPAPVCFDDNSVREAADHMAHEGAGRLVVVSRSNPTRVVGMLTSRDLVRARQRRLHESHRPGRTLGLADLLPKRKA